MLTSEAKLASGLVCCGRVGNILVPPDVTCEVVPSSPPPENGSVGSGDTGEVGMASSLTQSTCGYKQTICRLCVEDYCIVLSSIWSK